MKPRPGPARRASRTPVPGRTERRWVEGGAAGSARRGRGAAGQSGQTLPGLAGLLRAGRRRRAGGHGLRGPAVGGQRPGGLHRPSRRVEPGCAHLHPGAGPARVRRGAAGLGRRASGLHDASPSSRSRPTPCVSCWRPRAGLPTMPRPGSSRRADGVPLYAVEIVRMLVAQGSLELAGEAYRPVGDLADLAVPETLHSLISARLDALEPADRALLQAAAVLGQRSPSTGWRRSPRDGGSRGTADLARPPGARHPGHGSPLGRARPFAFVQSLIREVAYSTLRARPQGATSCRRPPLRNAHRPGVGRRAGDPLPGRVHNASEGPEADAIAGQARVALRGAGDRAIALVRPEQALGFFREALEVTSEPVERAMLLERAGEAACAAGLHEKPTACSTRRSPLPCHRRPQRVARVIGLQARSPGTFRASMLPSPWPSRRPRSLRTSGTIQDSRTCWATRSVRDASAADLPGPDRIADLALALADRLDRVISWPTCWSPEGRPWCQLDAATRALAASRRGSASPSATGYRHRRSGRGRTSADRSSTGILGLV